jgi:hypothetical protein
VEAIWLSGPVFHGGAFGRTGEDTGLGLGWANGGAAAVLGHEVGEVVDHFRLFSSDGRGHEIRGRGCCGGLGDDGTVASFGFFDLADDFCFADAFVVDGSGFFQERGTDTCKSF